jgi:hypothetical protein
VGLGDGDGDGLGLDGGATEDSEPAPAVIDAPWVAVTVVAEAGPPWPVSKTTASVTAAPTATITAPATASAERKLVCSIRA